MWWLFPPMVTILFVKKLMISLLLRVKLINGSFKLQLSPWLQCWRGTWGCSYFLLRMINSTRFWHFVEQTHKLHMYTKPVFITMLHELSHDRLHRLRCYLSWYLTTTKTHWTSSQRKTKQPYYTSYLYSCLNINCVLIQRFANTAYCNVARLLALLLIIFSVSLPSTQVSLCHICRCGKHSVWQ